MVSFKRLAAAFSILAVANANVVPLEERQLGTLPLGCIVTDCVGGLTTLAAGAGGLVSSVQLCAQALTISPTTGLLVCLLVVPGSLLPGQCLACLPLVGGLL